MHVYILFNSDTDIHVFDKEAHLLPSVRISYSQCQNVKITEAPFDMRYVTFTIEGIRSNQVRPVGSNASVSEDVPFKDTITFHRVPVWDEPSHL